MKPLHLSRFRELVAAYGGDLERFPAKEREAARALVESSGEARALVAAEAALDARFAEAEPPALGPSLERRLLEVPLRAPGARRWPFATRSIPALSWAAAAVVGVWLGTVLPDDEASADEPTVAEALPGTASDVATDLDGEEAALALAAGAFADLGGLR